LNLVQMPGSSVWFIGAQERDHRRSNAAEEPANDEQGSENQREAFCSDERVPDEKLRI
jgi:hypothetical protein